VLVKFKMIKYKGFKELYYEDPRQKYLIQKIWIQKDMTTQEVQFNLSEPNAM